MAAERVWQLRSISDARWNVIIGVTTPFIPREVGEDYVVPRECLRKIAELRNRFGENEPDDLELVYGEVSDKNK